MKSSHGNRHPASAHRPLWDSGRVLSAAGLLALVLLAAEFLRSRYVWLHDLPEWLYQGTQLWRVLLGREDRFTLVSFPVPNTTFLATFGLLCLTTGRRTAAVLYVVVLLSSALLLCLRYFSRRGDEQPLLPALAIVGFVFLGPLFWFGNANYLLSLLIFLAAATWQDALLRRPLLLGALLLLSFFTHAVGLLALCVFLLLSAPAPRRRALILASLPALVLLLWYFAGKAWLDPSGKAHLVSMPRTLRDLAAVKLSALLGAASFPLLRSPDYSSRFSPSYCRALGVLGVGWVLLITTTALRERQGGPALRFAALLLLCGTLVPSNVLGLFGLDHRLYVTALLGLLLGARPGPRAARLGALIMIAYTLSHALWVHSFASFVPTPQSTAALRQPALLGPIFQRESTEWLHQLTVFRTVPFNLHRYYTALDQGTVIPLFFDTSVLRNRPPTGPQR